MGVRAIGYPFLICVTFFIAGCSVFTTPPVNAPTQAGMDHKSTFFVAQKGVKDGYVFIFHVMPAPEGAAYSRSLYHLMVSVEKDGNPVTDITLYSTAKHPDGSIASKAPMMQMGNWYMALYNLSHEKGQHWLTVSFEQAGKTYSSGVYYPERAYHQ